VNEILDRAASELGEFLPRLAGAVLLLVLGLVAAGIAGALARRALAAAGIDELADRFGVHRTLGRGGIAPPLSRLLGRIARIVLSIVVIVAAVSLLGLAGVELALNEALLFLPKLVAALALVFAGLIVGEIVGGWVDRLAKQLALDVPVGRVAEAVVIALFSLTALAQIGVPTGILVVLAGILLVTAMLTATLAFGLGGRDLARQVSAGRYVHGAFELGQRISVGEITAEIVSFESAATVVRTDDGLIARIPNHLLLESVVFVRDGSNA
jgi:small-conductance mechanosensitive channel